MEILAFVAFAALVVGWCVAPDGATLRVAERLEVETEAA